MLLSSLLCAISLVVGEDDEVGMLMLNTAVELDTAGSFNLSDVDLGEQSFQNNGEDSLFQESGEDFRDAVGNIESDDELLPDVFNAMTYSYFPDERGDAPLYVETAMRIFDWKNSDFDWKNIEGADRNIWETSDMQSVSNQVATSLGFEAGFLGVSVSIAASNNATLKTNERVVRAEARKWVNHCEVTASVKIMSLKTQFQRLKPEVQELLLEATPQSISAKIGAFYPLGATYGAAFKSILMRKRKFKEDTTAWSVELSAGFENAIATAKGSSSFSNAKSEVSEHKELRTKSHVIGGDAIQLHKGEGLENWLNSVTRENMQPIEYTLKPLYELLKAVDLEKGKALEKYQTGIWRKSMEDLTRLDRLEVSKKPLSMCRQGGIRSGWKYDNTGGTFPYKMGLRVDLVRPINCDGEMHYPLGDIAHHDPWSKVPSRGIPMVAGDVVKPVQVEQIWHDNDGWHPGKVWKLLCPRNYVALGHVWTEHSTDVIDLKNYRCIPSHCAKPLKPSQVLFYNYHWVNPPAHKPVKVFHHPGSYMKYYFHAQLDWDAEPEEVFDVDPYCLEL